MCGIAGMVDWRAATSADALRSVGHAMIETVRHRGPDAGEVWVEAEGGVLRVRTRTRRGQAELLVSNSVAPQSASTPGHGIALRNVQERLRLLHDVAADFRARRDGDIYRVRIVVPLR